MPCLAFERPSTKHSLTSRDLFCVPNRTKSNIRILMCLGKSPSSASKPPSRSHGGVLPRPFAKHSAAAFCQTFRNRLLLNIPLRPCLEPRRNVHRRNQWDTRCHIGVHSTGPLFRTWHAWHPYLAATHRIPVPATSRWSPAAVPRQKYRRSLAPRALTSISDSMSSGHGAALLSAVGAMRASSSSRRTSSSLWAQGRMRA
jgi:hypothetical protein